jgi:hypothetical protein
MVKTRGGGVAQVVKLLPSKHEALSSNPSTAKTKKTHTIFPVNNPE